MTRYVARQPVVSAQHIEKLLYRRDRKTITAAVFALLGGTVFASIVALGVFGLAILYARNNGLSSPGWVTFGVIYIVVVPLALLGGYYFRGGMTAAAAEEGYDVWVTPFFIGVRGRAVAGVAIIETLMLLISLGGYGIRRLLAMRALARVNRQRAAEMLALLVIADEGVDFDSLSRPEEPWEEFRLTVDYLMFHELVGASPKRKLLWLNSDNKSHLLPG